MNHNTPLSRRAVVTSSVFGLMTVSLPGLLYARRTTVVPSNPELTAKLFHRYPSIDDEIVAEVVGVSHFNLDRLKELVEPRPELARATWDWSFGDWETALGAASHVGRRDIAAFLMSKGARPDIFTYAMLGSYDAVKAMIDQTPGIQRIAGPHGISLLKHVKFGMRSDDLTVSQKENSQRLLEYLESMGDADYQPEDIPMTAEQKQKYLGDYKYGQGEKEGFSVKLNMRDMLSLGKLGNFGGGLFQIATNEFIYNGTTSVRITFEVKDNIVRSLTVNEPNLVLKANKV